MNVENYEAEAAVLGAVLLDGTLFKELEVEEEFFYHARHKRIYRAMKEAFDKGEFIDCVVTTTYLGEAINQVGGTVYLLKMTESVASTASMKHHERLILDAYRLRKSREYTMNYSKQPSEQQLELLISQLQTIREAGIVHQEKTTYDYLLEITDEIVAPPGEAKGCRSPYKHLDQMTGGIHRGDLLIVAARPSVGKTAFALNLAAGHCKNGGTSSIFSLEMGTKPLLKRMISSEGIIDAQKWKSMAFSSQDYEEAIKAIGFISDWNLYIFDTKRTLMDIRSTIRRKKYDDPDGNHLVIIDYLQLISPAGKRERRDLEVGEITRELKLLAIELDIPIVLLSQLSRGVEARQNKRPLMSDLRESGNIEQDADVIFLLYRDDYYNKNIEKNTMEVIISKQRNGPTGTVELAFLKEYGKFADKERSMQ
ncbi:replicative DNA helicase [Virgibacillus oceani]|uniref:Replicative DNA helicase n=1 Tax=Virgibacillus oceani TaxID=1479511 RepID=A0A917HJN5_9BACI|nr:replicative DNA helicase [Virgibacillus oceani]GGG81244.1 replicative DNA helicase [Virgibacillus oceani]